MAGEPKQETKEEMLARMELAEIMARDLEAQIRIIEARRKLAGLRSKGEPK